ncbi:NAD-dependent epimerase/dehydratase family protein [Gordonia soli]|uniref:NAD-dependent epimerase/dehydratase domain-containing protein n=1 Tax=Gordonia soli NBRC 108243 TaxID=1223545 RepID=M0QFD2_9ACTN|nr:NAD-dependent epimerase/dehydratase family protein [Gordonia soli]GAC67011.1 hypothetical protein GS4_05_02240 [Gordonia soli NBRC 108243]
MKSLVLGARGAVGRVVVDRLRSDGVEVVPAGRTPPSGGVRVDLGASDGLSALARAARGVDVVVNASGVEDPRIGMHVGSTPLVEISATAAYLDALATDAAADATVVLGAGLAPGLSTAMIDALAVEPGDEVDMLISLGSGEAHGAAAVEWTARLIGADLHDPPERRPVRNLIDVHRGEDPGGRRRRYLRADFPDHLLLGRSRDVTVRSHLALSSPLATASLGLVARVPRLAPLVARSPHIGGADWHLVADARRSGERVVATGVGQSIATGVLTALAAQRIADRPGAGLVTMADVLTLAEIAGQAADAVALEPAVNRSRPMR